MSNHVRLGDIADIVLGYPFESELFNTNGDGICLVRGMNVTEQSLRFGSEARYWSYDISTLGNYLLKEGDIVIGMDGSKVGRNFAIVRKADLPLLLVQRVACVRAKNALLQPFLWAMISNQSFTNYVDTIKTGSSIFHISGTQISEYSLPSFNLDIMEAIGDFIWNIDSLIANNNAIRADLEAIAKLLYDYWFVQFDFPDENGKPYKSSGGKMVWNEDLKREIPDGWTISHLGNKCEILLGGTPDTSKAEYWDGDIPWLNSGEVAFSPVLSSEKTITKEGMNNSATAFAEAGAVVMSITRYIRPSILGIDACFNQSVVAVKPTKEFHTSYLYPLMKSNVVSYMKLRTGAQQPHINKETVENTIMLCPSETVLNDYYQLVECLYEKQMVVSKETQQLASLRDFLLPLLMNGQVKVGGKGDLPPVEYPAEINREEYQAAAEPKQVFVHDTGKRD